MTGGFLSSVGVIGGADGPTVIFVTGALGGWSWLIPVLAVAALAVAVVCMVRRKEKKHRK